MPSSRWRQQTIRLVLCGLTGGIAARGALADEGGVSFWFPGQFGSLAAVPLEPGWSLPVMYYHASSDASASKDFAIGGNITAGLDARADLLLAVPTYAFADPVLGGQLALSMAAAYGTTEVSANATLTGPRGNVLRKTRAIP